jgi:hypothetical protein
MPRLFLCHKNRVVQETWNGTRKSSVSSSIRMSMGTQLPYVVYLAGIRAHGWDPLVTTATGYFIVRGEYRGLTLLAELGWACVVRRRMVNGLDQ